MVALELPKTSKDFIGDPKNIHDLTDAIRRHDRVLLYGNPGVGKTSSVHVLARELGYEVIETNASDERRRSELNDILKRCQQQGMFGQKILFLLDEVDGLQAWVTVEEIIKKSIHPVILTANEEWRIPQKVKQLCTRLHYRPPLVQDVVKHVRKLTKETVADYSGVSQDVRSSIITVRYGGEKYSTTDIFSSVENLFKNSDPTQVENNHLPYLFDNAPRYYHGTQLYVFYQILDIAVRTRLSLLSTLPPGKGSGINFPYYLKRIRVLRGREEK